VARVDYPDYYATLGVPKTATESEIRTAYRKLARKHHPDVNPGNTEAESKFKEINEAYEVLSDPEKRKRYDELGSQWKQYEQWQQAQQAAGARSDQPFDWGGLSGQGPGGTRYEYRTVSEADLGDMFGGGAAFSDFFETFFGSARTGPSARGGGGRTRSRPGADLEHPIEISLADAYRGTAAELALRSPDGQVKRLEVKIPPGVRTGSRVRMSGQGGPGSGGGPGGDLYLVVAVQPDPRFERRGNDLHTRVRAPLVTLLLGGEARVPTPDGRTLALRVPAGTQDGRIFRLKGQGMPHLGKREGRGDLHAEVHALLPERLTDRERELIEELAKAGAGAPAGAAG
jgi:DnaJ-class molecular chaperone